MYQKTNWQSGDTITAAKLNNIENGIADGGVLVVNCTYDDDLGKYVLDATYSQIVASSEAVVYSGSPQQPTAVYRARITQTMEMGGMYGVYSDANNVDNTVRVFAASSADGVLTEYSGD